MPRAACYKLALPGLVDFKMNMRALRAFAVCCMLAWQPFAASAQGVFKRPARILVDVIPGGSADVQIRALLPVMSEALGQALIVDNRADPNGAMVAELAARSAPDGHTLMVGGSLTHAINAALHAKLAYDPVRDFAPISQLSATGLVLVGRPDLPGTTIQDLTAHAKRNPGRLTVGFFDLPGELASAALWPRLGVKLASTRFRDSVAAIQALHAGKLNIALLAPPNARPHVHGGRLKAYGVTGSDRASILPEVPTLAEQGVAGYEFPLWHGLFAPAGTPREIVLAVHKAVAVALQDADVRTRYDQLGLTVIGSSPEEFEAVVKHDIARLRKLVEESGVRR